MSAPGSRRVWRRAIRPHRRGSRPAGRPLAREELSENTGAQPPTLEPRTFGCCTPSFRPWYSGILVVMTVACPHEVTHASEQRSLEILTALGACVRARRWAGRRVWAGKWARRRLRARGGAAATSRPWATSRWPLPPPLTAFCRLSSLFRARGLLWAVCRGAVLVGVTCVLCVCWIVCRYAIEGAGTSFSP